MSWYLHGHISRFRAYSTELAHQPEAFNPVLKEIVGFAALGVAA